MTDGAQDISTNYVDWIKDTRSCADCGACAPETQNWLYNANLPLRRQGSYQMYDITVVPQAGFVGPEYHQQPIRLLVLGKNPGGGDEGDVYYSLQTGIVDQISLAAATPLIVAEVRRRWKPLLDMNLFTHVRPEQIAYANQILCRTVTSASEIENLAPTALEAIYATCFRSRILPLVRTLRPHHIIAMGAKQYNSWPPKLKSMLQAEPDCANIQVHGVIFPFGSHKATARAQLLTILDEIGWERTRNDPGVTD